MNGVQWANIEYWRKTARLDPRVTILNAFGPDTSGLDALPHMEMPHPPAYSLTGMDPKDAK